MERLPDMLKPSLAAKRTRHATKLLIPTHKGRAKVMQVEGGLMGKQFA
jgi:hypothetical protein